MPVHDGQWDAAFAALGKASEGFVTGAAPGVDVTIGTRKGGYRKADGTSFSSPMVAGVVADWLQANPKLDVSDVQHIIRETSRPIPGERHENARRGPTE